MSFIRKVGLAAATAGLVLTLIPGSVAAQSAVSVTPPGAEEPPPMVEGSGNFTVTGSFTWTGENGQELNLQASSVPELPELPDPSRGGGTPRTTLTGPELDYDCVWPISTPPVTDPQICNWTFRYPALDDVVATVTITATVEGSVPATTGAGVRPRVNGDTASDDFTLTVTNADPDTDQQMQFYAIQNGELWGSTFDVDEGPYTLVINRAHDPGPLDTLNAKFDCGDGVWHDGVLVSPASDYDRFKFQYECPGDTDGGYGIIPGSPYGEINVRARVCDDDATTCSDIDLLKGQAKSRCSVVAGSKCSQPDPIAGDGKRTITKPVEVTNSPPEGRFTAPQTAVEGTPYTLRIVDVVDVPADLVPPPGITFQFNCNVDMDDTRLTSATSHLTKAQRARILKVAAAEDDWLPADTVSADGTSATKACTHPNGPETVYAVARMQDKDMAVLGNSSQISSQAKPNNGTSCSNGGDGCWVYFAPRRVQVTNAPPVVEKPVVTVPTAHSAAIAVNVRVTAAFSDIGSNDSHICDIDWGDAKVPGAVTEANGAGTCTGSHTYTTSGRFRVEVTIADNDGGSRSAATSFTVDGPSANVKPVVSKPTFTGAGAVTTPMSASFTDANTTDTHICDIDWGDGISEAGVVTEANGAGTCTGSHTFGGPGSYSVQATITDSQGGVRSASAVYVVPAPPVAPGTGTITIVQDSLPNRAQDFAFDDALGKFSLDDDSIGTLPRARTFSGLAPGGYTVEQVQVSGWSLVDISCDTGERTDLTWHTVGIDLADGEHVTCTFSNALRQPDGRISQTSSSAGFIGNDIYSATAIAGQTQTRTANATARTYTFWVKFQNDSKATDRFTLKATQTLTGGATVVYRIGGNNRTAAILAGTFVTSNRAPGAKVAVQVKVTVPAGTGAARATVTITAASSAEPTKTDVVRAVITR